jgi:hypothetical protein
MTVGDLMVIVPWVIFGAGVVIVCLRLRRPRRLTRRPSASGDRRGRHQPGRRVGEPR